MEILLGMPLLVLFMMLVMGIPFAYYLKHDIKYEAAAHNQPENIRIKSWYERFSRAH